MTNRAAVAPPQVVSGNAEVKGMIRRVGHSLLVVTALSVGVLFPARAQTIESFERAVEVARLAWLRHDIEALLSLSDTIRLHLPDGGRSVAIRPHHAERVLKAYLKDTRELEMVLRSVRSVAADHRYAEMTRRFVVPGTADEREQTVFFGLRLGQEGWAIREVRISP